MWEIFNWRTGRIVRRFHGRDLSEAQMFMYLANSANLDFEYVGRHRTIETADLRIDPTA